MTNGTVQVKLRVTNRKFIDDLQDVNSFSYQDFVRNFTKQVEMWGRVGTPPGVMAWLCLHRCWKHQRVLFMVFSGMCFWGDT